MTRQLTPRTSHLSTSMARFAPHVSRPSFPLQSLSCAATPSSRGATRRKVMFRVTRQPAVQEPAIGASDTQRRRRSNQETPRYRIGQGKTPLAPRHQEKLACGRAGTARARIASLTRAATAHPLTLPQDLPSNQSGSGSSGTLLLALLLKPTLRKIRDGADAGGARARCSRRSGCVGGG